MAKLNMSLIKEQLAAAKRTVKKNTSGGNSRLKELVWKPEEGENLIRIIPNQYQEGNPFIKVNFYYKFTANINGEERSTTYISPSNFGKPDPVIELSERLQKSGDKKLWGRGMSLLPKPRWYVPIIVRGKEEEGIKFWGFGVQIFDQLVLTMDEPDYSEMIDLNNGNDIKVEFIPAEKSNKMDPKTGKKFPDTKIFIKPKSRPVIDPSHPKAKEILDLITTKQPKLIEAWECPSYDSLAAALESYLKKLEQGRSASREQTEEDDNVVIPTEEQIDSATRPVTNVVSPSAAKAETNATTAESSDDMNDVYNDLFNVK